MSIDTLLAAGQAAAGVHTAVDRVIDAALYYGPGVLVTAVVIAVWCACRWAVRRYEHLLQDRADRREYAARAYRLCRVADNADAFLAMPPALINARLEAHLATTPDLADEGEER
ncbi:hypothetical protein J7F02_28245 [Streptomyces sp. ISL-112]|uniref:hypothetical protein n=1 Tax=unclassified Streptomyces TaxID=2593676 RepID=UPI001BE6078A|nr:MULTISPECIES: hypothetical protein [unclassified Streptomyces]MBT2429401.1 hypothetical protein [Streptomyces sp. ISL-112]MBT2463993.1 hypothetical protein [Streptomyces sp. ISL-63]